MVVFRDFRPPDEGVTKKILIIQTDIFFPFFCAIAHQNRSPQLGFIAENRWFFFWYQKKTFGEV